MSKETFSKKYRNKTTSKGSIKKEKNNLLQLRKINKYIIWSCNKMKMTK